MCSSAVTLASPKVVAYPPFTPSSAPGLPRHHLSPSPLNIGAVYLIQYIKDLDTVFIRTERIICERSGSQWGCAAAPMHMAMWGHGRVDADEGSIIDAILGIPAYTIKMAGVHGLPDDYMMQISARGSAYKPDIDWLRWAPGPHKVKATALQGPELARTVSERLLCSNCLSEEGAVN